jgi:hypothetical protein
VPVDWTLASLVLSGNAMTHPNVPWFFVADPSLHALKGVVDIFSNISSGENSNTTLLSKSCSHGSVIAQNSLHDDATRGGIAGRTVLYCETRHPENVLLVSTGYAVGGMPFRVP